MANESFHYDLVDDLELVVAAWVGEAQLGSVKVNGQAWSRDHGVYTRDLGSCRLLKTSGIVSLDVDAVVLHSNAHTTKGSLSIELYQITAANDPNGFPGRVFRDRTFVVPWEFSVAAVVDENVVATVFLH
jgi:hypothetical protein